jgi:ATP-dependent Clp protease ATP-binding subunit ClpC
MFESEILSKLTLHAQKSLKEAGDIALHSGAPEVRSEHLLVAIYLQKGSSGNNLLSGLNLKRQSFEEFILKETVSPSPLSSAPKLSEELKALIVRAYFLASEANSPYVGTEHLALAILDSNNPTVQKILAKNKTKKVVTEKEQMSMGNDPLGALSKIFDLPELTLAKNRKNQLHSTPSINQFCTDLNEESAKHDEIIIGREKELERIIAILGRKYKNNPVLVGDPGVGKTALVSGLAKRLRLGEVPPHLAGKKIMALDMALVVAGTSFRGEFEARIKEIIREATENEDIILFIDEIHNIVGAGNSNGGLDAANILKPALSRGLVQCIGATTFGEYKKYIEKDPALERRFQPIKVNEPTVEEAKKILLGIKGLYESFHNATILPEALDSAVELSVRYVADRFLPDKAIDLIDETASTLRSQGKNFDLLKKIRKFETDREIAVQEKNRLIGEEKYDEAMFFREQEKKMSTEIEKLKNEQHEKEKMNPVTISALDIAFTVSRSTGIPMEKIQIPNSSNSAPAFKKIGGLKKYMETEIIGQDEAIAKIANVLARSYSGISNPDRPLGSFLFLGPTGVGKTLTAKKLAEQIFGTPESLVRIDMSEFMERHNLSRLTGAPAGYIGYEEGGKLTEKIRHNPFSVVLFDEIEKAHPDVFNILLQILEDGTLTDAEGRKINFRNTIIILTSNIGTHDFTASAKLGFDSDKEIKNNPEFQELQNKVLEELRREIKPEILNRLDHIVVFEPLGKVAIEKIVRLELDKLKKRLRKQGLDLKFGKELSSFIAKKSLIFSEGARLIRKNIQELVENQIAEAIVERKVKNNKLSLNIKKDKITVI